MNLIEKIEINYFRSLYHISIKQISDLNILTGKNDAGKSNVLKALNLFFNSGTDIYKLDFINDFNKQRASEIKQDSIKGKQFIQIKITFNNIENFKKTLPKKFIVTKTWQKDGTVVFTDNIKYLIEKSGNKFTDRNTASLTNFLKKIKYFYVPAIKDKHIFQNLLFDLRDTLYDTILKGKRNVDSVLDELNTAISKSALELNNEYKNVTGIETELATTRNLDELFKALNINTKYKGYDIPLDYRGDGIRVRYLPSILDYIAKNSKSFCIWGFEEPENSLEYNLANDMAKQFANEYSKKAQIFITTHSIAFFNISSQKSQLYRCFNSESGKGTELKIYEEARNDLIIDKDIGIFEIQKELHREYEKKLLQKSVEIENIKSIIVKYENEFKTIQKPVVLTEGKTDVLILRKAWDALYDFEMPFIIKSCNLYGPENTESAGGSDQLKNLISCIPYDHVNEMVIGVFDRDTSGLKAFALNNNFINIIDDIKRHKNGKAYAIILPVVEGLENFAKFENLSIEFYFDKIHLNKEKNGKKLKLIPDDIVTTVRGITKEQRNATEFYLQKIDNSTKVFFAEEIVPTFEKSAFANFNHLFKYILRIINKKI